MATALIWIRRQLPVLVSAGLALVLVFRGLEARPLSVDEFYTLHALVHGLPDHMWEAPLIPYYSLMWLWTLGGQHLGDAWLRSLTVLASIVTAAATCLTAQHLAGRRAAYASGVLVAVNPALQAYGLDARPYAVGMAIFSFATYTFVRGFQTNRNVWWIAYTCLVVAGIAVMPQGAVILVVHGCYLIFTRCKKAIVFKWASSLVVVAPMLLIGAALIGKGSYQSMHEWVYRPGIIDVPKGLLWIGDAAGADVSASAAVGMSLLVLGLLTAQGRAWLGGAFLALGCIWLVSMGPISFWLGQSLLPLVPVVALAAGLSLASFSARTTCLVIVFVALLSLPAFTYLRLPRSNEPDMRKAVEIFARERSPGDQVRVFGLNDAYGLYPALLHYRPDLADVNATPTPTGRVWAAQASMPCSVISEWSIDGTGYLRLCATP